MDVYGYNVSTTDLTIEACLVDGHDEAGCYD